MLNLCTLLKISVQIISMLDYQLQELSLQKKLTHFHSPYRGVSWLQYTVYGI